MSILVKNMENIRQNKQVRDNRQIRNQFRAFYKARREAMPLRLTERKSGEICAHILHWKLYQDADAVLFYYPLGKEVSLLAVIKDALVQKKHIAFPKVTGKTMQFYEVCDLGELQAGSFQIMEPDSAHTQPIAWEPDLCFVPGTAFDRKGARIGYGRGYYDRYFADKETVLAGCAYECQIAGCLPMAAWDQKMAYLITERGILSV